MVLMQTLSSALPIRLCSRRCRAGGHAGIREGRGAGSWVYEEAGVATAAYEGIGDRLRLEPWTGCGQYEGSQVLEIFPFLIPCSPTYARLHAYPI